jgi:hypothetical protein
MNKLTFEYVNSKFLESGCELLENEYRNAHIKMKYKCSCGNKSEIKWNNFQQGKRCKKCSIRRQMDLQRYSFEYVRDCFKSHGCELLSEYKRINDDVKYRCSCGRVAKIRFSKFKLGQRCKNCRYKKTSQSLALSQEEVENYFKQYGCELLSEYKNARTKVKYRCCCGDISSVVFYSFKNGNRCKQCGIEKKSGSNSSRWIEDREAKAEYDLFKKKCYSMVARALKSFSLEKNLRTQEMLGYSIPDLQEHIVNHPNWNKVKDDSWHLDHIFPVSAFYYHGIKDIKLVNALDNLQPLSQIENNKKSGNYDKEEFYRYLLRKGKKWK